MMTVLAGLLSLAGVVLGAAIARSRIDPRLLYVPTIANTTPPAMADLEIPIDPNGR